MFSSRTSTSIEKPWWVLQFCKRLPWRCFKGQRWVWNYSGPKSERSFLSTGRVSWVIWVSWTWQREPTIKRTTCLEERGTKETPLSLVSFLSHGKTMKNLYESTSGLVFFSVTLHVFLQAFQGKVYLPGNSFCDIFGMVMCLFQGFCDLQLGD